MSNSRRILLATNFCGFCVSSKQKTPAILIEIWKYCSNYFCVYCLCTNLLRFEISVFSLLVYPRVSIFVYRPQSVNKTGTSQVGAISKAQKAQNIFFGKKLEIFEKKNFRKMSHSAEKCKGGPFLIYKHAFCSKITKNSKGDPLRTLKNFEKKVSQCRKKSNGGTL